jgi:diaminopimelate epimerase
MPRDGYDWHAAMQLEFEKYEATGNDFIVVRTTSPTAVSAEQAMALCDRHFGIGADGVLLISPSGEGRARMTVLNADGSRPEMCGNGLRCAALAVTADDHMGDDFVMLTDAGLRSCLLRRTGPDRASVTTELGRAEEQGQLTHPLGSRGDATFVRISMGNPHAIVFAPPLSAAELDELGTSLSARIAGGSNVEVASIVGPQCLDLAVWERGVGRTLACGTGAAATAAAAVALGLARAEEPIEVRLPGGSLELRVAQDRTVTLTGPARRVFRGRLPA